MGSARCTPLSAGAWTTPGAGRRQYARGWAQPQDDGISARTPSIPPPAECAARQGSGPGVQPATEGRRRNQKRVSGASYRHLKAWACCRDGRRCASIAPGMGRGRRACETVCGRSGRAQRLSQALRHRARGSEDGRPPKSGHHKLSVRPAWPAAARGPASATRQRRRMQPLPKGTHNPRRGRARALGKAPKAAAPAGPTQRERGRAGGGGGLVSAPRHACAHPHTASCCGGAAEHEQISLPPGEVVGGAKRACH